MDHLQYEQYLSVVLNHQLSIDALKRIIKHDKVSGWENTPGGLAREQVIKDYQDNKLDSYKLYDEKDDQLYGNEWPLPLNFIEVK
jgi:hypothetical protein